MPQKNRIQSGYPYVSKLIYPTLTSRSLKSQLQVLNPSSSQSPYPSITQLLTMDSAKVLKAPTYSKSHTMRMPRKARARRMERTRRSCPVFTEEDKITAT